VKGRIDLAYLQTDMAQFVFFDFPLVNAHPHAFLAARAARCAGDAGVEQYFKYHDALYINQTAWSISSAPARLFVDYSRDLGLDVDAFEGCLRSDRHADVVSANLRLAEEMALPGTPSVLVQGPGQALPQRLSESSFEAIAQAVATMNPGTP
jgi:protein-disulfide isomerase